jgi:acylpyruvate hydrolase
LKLATYRYKGETSSRIGAAIELNGVRHLIDLAAAQAKLSVAGPGLEVDMRQLLELGEPALGAARAVVGKARVILGDSAEAAVWESARLMVAEHQIALLAPVPRPGKLIMVGSNYKSHVGEAGPAANNLPPARSEKHDWPAAFSKFPSVVVGPDEPIPYPSHTRQLDYEAELCVVIGQRCRAISEADAETFIAGYTIGNDISLRDIQFAEMRRGLILLGKNSDASSPLGPYLVTRDEIPDPQNLRIRCWVNGTLRQDDTTAHMMFSVRQLVSYFSRVTLEPGDVIATGTPAGVGIFQNPPDAALLKVGDRIDIEIDRIGRLSNTIVAEAPNVRS